VAEERDKRCAAERQRRLEREGVARDVQQLSAALRRFEAYGSHFVHTAYTNNTSSSSLSLSPRRSARQPPLRQQQQQQQQQQQRSGARSAATRRRCPPGWARDSSDADSQGLVWSGLAATAALLPGALEQEVEALKARLTACLSGVGTATAAATATGIAGTQETELLQHSSALQQSDAPRCDTPHSDADDEYEEAHTAAHSAVDSVTGSSGSDSELHAEVVRLRDRIASLRERREQLAAAEATRSDSAAG
jgi:transcription initiation factor TFIID subunit TAF12